MADSALMHRPRTRAELLDLLVEVGDEAKLLAGGTALTILRKAGMLSPEHLISLAGVPDLAEIERVDGATQIGALARLRTVERSTVVREHHPVLAGALSLVANTRVRNVATMGGNVSEADPTSDPPGVLTALDAVVHMASAAGDRHVTASEFFVDYFETAVRHDEVVTRVEVPDFEPGWGGTYLKFVSRSAEDRTCVGVAAFVHVQDDVCHGLRLAIVGAGPVPVRVPGVEQSVIGRPLRGVAVDELVDAYLDAADPVSDVRGSADYRVRVLEALIPEALERAGRRTDDAVFA